MVARPRIGINGDYRREERERTLLVSAYYDAVALAGGLPMILPPLPSEEDVTALLAGLDGVLLTGGRDYDPATYGEVPVASTRLVHPRREAFDLLLARAVVSRGIPGLGICGGAQLLNIACGGDLSGDIRQDRPDAIAHEERGGRPVYHDVEIDEGSRLQAVVGSKRIQVNSSHHQAVKNPGDGLRIVARSPDGVIEAVEAGDKFLLGVQWHPERLTDSAPHRRIFEAFIEACRRKDDR